MQLHDITILLPTRGRPALAAQRLAEIKHRPLLFIVDRGRRHLDLPGDLDGADVVECEPECGAPRAIESGVLAAKTKAVLGLTDCICSADMVPRARAIYAERFGAQDAVVAINDGVSKGSQACYFLTTRRFYLDHIFPCTYQRYYIDTELTRKAQWLGLYAYAPDAVAQHLFVDGQNARIMSEDHELFEQRMANFRAGTPRYATHLMVALPVYGQFHPVTVQGITHLTAHPPCKISFRYNLGNSIIGLARNQLSADFLASDCTHMLFVDSDIGFNAEDVAALLSRDVDIVGGLYPYKSVDRADFVCNALPEAPPDRDGLREVLYLGTGFLMIRRRVFSAMLARFGSAIAYRSDYQPRTEHDFWPVGVHQYPDGRSRHLSEDWYFCERARQCGFRIYADTRVRLRHAGTHIFSPAPSQPHN